MTRRLQQLIHVGCRELGLDADDRRALQLRLTGKDSMSAMTDADLRLVVDDLRRQGFKPASGKRPKAIRADVRLIHVMWARIGATGALEKPGRAGLNAFIRKRFGDHWGSVPADVDMLIDHGQIADVIDALRAWGDRVGADIDMAEARRR